MLIPPLLIIASSIYAYTLTLDKLLLFPALISIFAFFSCILLIHLARDAKNSSSRVSSLIFPCLYLLHFSSAAYFATGLLLVFVFSFQESITHSLSLAILCVEGASVKFIFGYGLLFILFRKLTIEYHTIRHYVQIMQITLLMCGAGICMTCLAYRSSWNNLNMHYQVPPVIVNLGIATGAVVSVVSLLTFCAAYTERLSVLLLCQIFDIILIMFLFLYGAMARYSNELYQKMISDNCSYILKILNAEMFSCQKYLESRECDREFLATVWEEGGEEKCLNSECCNEMQEKITLYLEFLVIWAILTCILLVFSWLAGQGLVKKIEKFGKSKDKSLDIKLISLIFIVTLVSLAGWFTFDNQEQKITKNSAIVRVLNAEILESIYFPSDLCETLEVALDPFEEYSEVKVDSADGVVSPGVYTGKFKQIQTALSKSTFCANYPKELYEIQISVTSSTK